jgi:hypothetical protein
MSARAWLVGLVLVGACSGTPAAAPPPASAPPATDGPQPGGCVDVTIEPPCTFRSIAPTASPQDPPGTTSYLVLFVDAHGREIQPYHLVARPEEREALETFYRASTSVACSGGWVSPPCPDMARYAGFPTPPIGTTTPM